MKEYATRDIANIVGIAPPTVRKYSQSLEKAGYNFMKNDRGFRIFTDNDIPVFKEMISKSNDTGMNVEQIALMLVQKEKANTDESIQTISEVATASEKGLNNNDLIYIDSDVKELKDTVEKQNLLILELMKRMDYQQKYIEERLDNHDARLMQSIRESQETKKLLLETKEQQEQKKPRKGLLRFFSKD